ncbi:MAG: hypothetical protein HWE07_06755 [Cytophagia bacterium]|nr:hypothetical protein [Cytophagia bacterium]
MRKIVLGLIFLCPLYSSIYAQKWSLDRLQDYISAIQKDTDHELSQYLILIDGVPTEPLEVDSILSFKQREKSKVFVDYIIKEQIVEVLPHSNADLVLFVMSAEQEKTARIKKHIKRLLKAFPRPQSTISHTFSDSIVPVLIIDGEVIDVQKFWQKLENLDPKEIFSMKTVIQAPKSLFGSHAKNGLEIIWTKD